MSTQDTLPIDCGTLEPAARTALDCDHQYPRQLLGIAEVLHDVGNALSRVNIGVNYAYQILRDSKLPSLSKAAEMLDNHKPDLAEFLSDDPRGKLLPVYLTELAENLTRERETLLKELATLTRNLEHIKAILATQLKYAGLERVMQPLSLPRLLSDAEQISGIGSYHQGITVLHDYDLLPEVVSDEQKLLQVLVNLLKNAAQSIRKQHGPEGGEIAIHAEVPADEIIRIEITDNGAGISYTVLPEIFRRGFTTRADGHGFGLHSCGKIVKELGGTLEATSEGEGTGATFAIEIPFQPQTIETNE